MTAKIYGQRIEFNTPPQLGIEVEFSGQPFELVAISPWSRRDGTATSVLTWLGSCAQCGMSFEQTTGMRGYLQQRRCKAHRKLGSAR